VPGFEILGVLGKGGMGVVYKARHTKLKRLVALKMIRGDALAGAEHLARFQVEAEALARLQHPNIVQIYEVGSHANNPFFALEFVDGGDLATRLDDTPQPSRWSAEMLETLARAMHVAHEQNIIHRDLKPANVLLSQEGTPKITDFGLAKKLEEPGFTHSSVIMGTPSYMAPEQATGRVEIIGPLSDVYALGAMLYEMLTGRVPFVGENSMDTLLLVTTQEPVPPRQLQPKIPRDLETICLKCLEKQAQQRYASALELALELRRFLNDEPILARPVGLAARMTRWCRRNPLLALASSVAGLALIAAFVLSISFGFYQAHAAEQLRDALKQSEENNLAAQRLSATLALDRGLNLCEQGQADAGLLWLGRGLELANRVGADDLETVIRANVSGWRRQLTPLLARLDHPWDLQAVAISPDGRLVVTGSSSGKIQIWDVNSRRRLGPPLEHPQGVNALAFSPDSRTIVSGGFDSVRVWNVATHQLAYPPLQVGVVESLAFSPDGKQFLVGDRSANLYLWDTATGKMPGEPIHPGYEVMAVAFSPDGKTFLTGGYNHQAQLWDVATRKPILAPILHPHVVRAVSFSPDGKLLLTGCWDNRARLWETATGKAVREPLLHQHYVNAVAFSPDGKFILTSSRDKTARLWETATGLPVGAPLQHPGDVVGLAFRFDGRTVLTGCEDGKARLWRVNPEAITPVSLPHPHQVYRVDYAPDGRRLVTGCPDGVVRFWDASTGRALPLTLQHTDYITDLSFSRDGRAIATASRDHTARVWDAVSGKPLYAALRSANDVNALALRADGKLLLTGCSDSTAQLWDVASGKPLLPPLRHDEHVLSVALSPDGRLALTACYERGLRFWDTRTGQAARPPLAHPGFITGIAFSPDGKSFATACGDYFARLWRTEDCQPLGLPFRHRDFIASVRVNPDGRLLLTGCHDSTARLWDIRTAKLWGPPFRHPSRVTAAVFSPDGRRVLTGCEDSFARIWDVPPPLEDDVAQIVRWIECSTGLELTADGIVRALDDVAWQEKCERQKR
jgi:WD40 repeat protein/tRNA A-37 threonylcarbamoyl transferase component Bud32